MGLYTLLLLTGLALLTPGVISNYRTTGLVGENLILTCFYPVTRHTTLACWGRGDCTSTGCNHPVATINGSRVMWTKSMRYKVTGDTGNGELPLTITDVNLDDSGVYCCRVRIQNLGIDLKREIDVAIQHPMMPDNLLQGSVDDTLTLTCKYPVDEGPREVCWGRGSCPISGCKNKLISTDGTKVTWSESKRYNLLGNITRGDVSLTISGLAKDQEDTYCCRVRIPGPFNDIKNEIKLEIKDVVRVTASLRDTLVLPCSYSADAGTNPVCWGHGHCGLFSCHNKVLESDGDEVTWKESDKYQVTGNMANGNVSLTIKNANEHDGGVYCCRVKVPGAFNDIKKEIRVQIREADQISGRVGDMVKLPCKYDVSEGTSPMCWGKGSCPTFKCTNTIVWTDGDDVTWTESEKYKLRGNIETGDVSLTIKSVTKEDEGMYCCRVEVPGLFNDKISEISLEVEYDLAAPAEMVTGLVNGMINMPCRYTNQGSEYTMCWGRGGCPIYRCTDEIIRTNGKEVTWRKFNRYQLLGNIIDGDVSLTIIRVTKQDEGTYCCRVEVKGFFNDQKKELELKVEEENPVNANHHPTPTEQDSFSMLEECPDDTT
ncbi:polymeric immunoglobulin receptor-like [Bufo gargarizans]|uniref:polymeric immunoglobulin receptor-like n=1 Tax=Bufo gargarizans TaxID=30331 RepID=UPI001CF499D2|nr:polymeric immunoglobulin receptor-like [Bufo gargarizans]